MFNVRNKIKIMAIETAIPLSELTPLIMVQSTEEHELDSIEDFAYENLKDYSKHEFKCILDMLEVRRKMI